METNGIFNDVQNDEISLLQSIYENEISFQDEWYYVNINVDGEDNLTAIFQLAFQYHSDYPNSSPLFRISCSPEISKQQTDILITQITKLHESGEPSLYTIIEWIRTNALQELESQGRALIFLNNTQSITEDLQVDNNNSTLSGSNIRGNDHHRVGREIVGVEIFQGEPLTDRKSTFQAFGATVTSLDSINEFLSALKSNKKIAQATHNMYAYRISHNNRIVEDKDDDGEGGAGDNLLHLLVKLNLVDVIVMVSRWYGGIKLGSDRFRIITECARSLISTHKIGFPSS